ncbi:MAG: hypothetical protein RMK52_03910 [Chitinophagales bacterium]|nr:ABC transporter substrate-binding protein [Chitinophagales bacterium]MDW8393373.1 hypothetical protein [Chitinophagales bacterium]
MTAKPLVWLLLLFQAGAPLLLHAQNTNRFTGNDTIFRIGVLLPLHSNRVFVNSEEDFFFPAETQTAVEYYQGLLLALEELANRGMNADIQVVNTSDSAQLEQDLRLLQNAHLLFTTAQGHALKHINRFSARHQVPLVYAGPVPSMQTWNNPYFILTSATLRTHCEFLFDYIYQRHFADRILLIGQPQVAQEKELTSLFLAANQRKVDSGLYPLPMVVLADSARPLLRQLNDSLSSLLTNVVIVASTDAHFINSVTTQLVRHNSKRIQLIGMPGWRALDRLSLSALDTLNCLASSAFFYDRNDSALVAFRKRYQSRFQLSPSENAVRGYDHGLYFGNQLYRFGRWMMGAFPPPAYSPLACVFKVVPVMKGEDVIYRENKGLFLLTVDRRKWRKATG